MAGWLTLSRLAIALGCKPDQMVHITDQQPMMALMQQNIKLNELDGAVHASVYDWGSAPTEQTIQHPDVRSDGDGMLFVVTVADCYITSYR